MSLHAFVPLHVMEQRESLLQTTSWQAPSPVQLTVQVQPVGQVTVVSHGASVVQSTLQVRIDSLHVVQSSGQSCATQ
jgi:hypothetical protein